MRTGRHSSIVVSALHARASFGKLLRRVEDERRSLVIEKRGAPKAVLLSIRDYVEYREVLARPELKIRRGLRQQLLQLVRNHSQLVRAVRPLRVAKDPGGDKFLECADAARADYLVTGNQCHFPKFWKNTKVIAAREFIGVVAPHLVP